MTSNASAGSESSKNISRDQNDEDRFLLSLFPHRLPTSRLGEAHASLESYRNAIHPFQHETTKEYTLVLVTEPANKRILLGKKHRGFGQGMFNSFGGKLEAGESVVEGAVRELGEETGIVCETGDLQRVATLHFTFDDSPKKMLVHLLRLNVQCVEPKAGDAIPEGQQETTCYFTLDPSVIRGCDEITPFWVDDWFKVPLNNMFADDSVWLTRVLHMPATVGSPGSTTKPIFEGYFHFVPGGQETNAIQHYHLRGIPPLTKEQPRSLEKRLFHELHKSGINSPSVKEFKEAWAFCQAILRPFGKSKTNKLSIDVVLDVCGGHGALAAMLLMLIPSAKEAVVIDPADVGAVQRAWGPFLTHKKLRYRYECLRTGLRAELETYRNKNVLVVACHACQHLSEEVLEISCREYAAAGVAVMPCCQTDRTYSWKSAAKNMGLGMAPVMDLLLAGRVMGWTDVGATIASDCEIGAESPYSYDVRMKVIEAAITPQNRIIVCKRIDGDVKQKQSNKDDAHRRLKVAYEKAHVITNSRAAARKNNISNRLTTTAMLVWDVFRSPTATFTMGVCIGLSAAALLRSRDPRLPSTRT